MGITYGWAGWDLSRVLEDDRIFKCLSNFPREIFGGRIRPWMFSQLDLRGEYWRFLCVCCEDSPVYCLNRVDRCCSVNCCVLGSELVFTFISSPCAKTTVRKTAR